MIAPRMHFGSVPSLSLYHSGFAVSRSERTVTHEFASHAEVKLDFLSPFYRVTQFFSARSHAREGDISGTTERTPENNVREKRMRRYNSRRPQSVNRSTVRETLALSPELSTHAIKLTSSSSFYLCVPEDNARSVSAVVKQRTGFLRGAEVGLHPCRAVITGARPETIKIPVEILLLFFLSAEPGSGTFFPD